MGVFRKNGDQLNLAGYNLVVKEYGCLRDRFEIPE